MSRKYDLLRRPKRARREATSCDMLLFMEAIYAHPKCLTCKPPVRLGLHGTYILLSLIGARVSNVVMTRYEQVKVSIIRNPFKPQRLIPVVTFMIPTNKHRVDSIQQNKEE